jgi:hypothetical protein
MEEHFRKIVIAYKERKSKQEHSFTEVIKLENFRHKFTRNGNGKTWKNCLKFRERSRRRILRRNIFTLFVAELRIIFFYKNKQYKIENRHN